MAQNVDNSTRRQFFFVFAAQLACSDEARNNIAGSGFYKSFADWLERCTAGGKLPMPEKSGVPLFDKKGSLRIRELEAENERLRWHG